MQNNGTLFDALYAISLKRARHRAWVLSDLQQGLPEDAKECLDICLADFQSMDHPADMIFCLGDAVEGADLRRTEIMSDLMEAALASTGLPVSFVMGNHDLQYALAKPENPLRTPFYEAVKRHPGWHTTQTRQDWYFKIPFGSYMVYFFSDHIAEDKSWAFLHGGIRGEGYPCHDLPERVRAEIAAEPCPVITASHYAYAGGNRASAAMSRLLPLPGNVKLHLYGHAHIGDYDWAGKDAYRRISWVDDHDIPQIEVSSFEHIRGKTCRSVFLHIHEDNSLGIFFRDHDHGVFSECYFPSPVQYPSKAEEEALAASSPK